MNFTILGSGGCVSTPRPLCTCSVCEQARRLGPPYARCGCCLYIEDAQAIVDTPEDVCAALNRGGVRAVNRILYSHADPDHTMGMRVLEQLRLDWLAESTGSRMKEPIEVVALPRVVDDLRAQATCYGSMLAYYEQKGLARLNACTQVQMDGVRATLVPVDETGRVTVFVFEQAGRRLVYAPCDVKPFPSSPLFEGADCLVVGNTVIGDVLKDGFVLGAGNPLRQELFTLEEIVRLKERLQIPDVVMTHLEEDWGKSYDDYRALEASYPGIRFAYDGMRIEL